jgi:hypothetical protein
MRELFVLTKGEKKAMAPRCGKDHDIVRDIEDCPVPLGPHDGGAEQPIPQIMRRDGILDRRRHLKRAPES